MIDGSVKKASITLESDIRYLKGIGGKRSAALRDVGVEKLIDLLYYAPAKNIDRSMVVSVAKLRKNWWEFQRINAVTFIGRVVDKKILVSSGGRQILEIVIDDGTG